MTIAAAICAPSAEPVDRLTTVVATKTLVRPSCTERTARFAIAGTANPIPRPSAALATTIAGIESCASASTAYAHADHVAPAATSAREPTLVASLPLKSQPGDEWNYSRSTDILGRIIEVVSGKSLGAFLTERILAPLQMAETAFFTGEENAGRLALEGGLAAVHRDDVLGGGLL